MIVGSGLIAKAFRPYMVALENFCIYAAGVSNSSCVDAGEFARDCERLRHTLRTVDPATVFVYFSTCSVNDPSQQDSRYVVHKSALEDIVRQHANHLVVRCPQVAGFTPNPHTVLNYLYARISRSERFDLWQNASRNIIDVEDVARIVCDLLLVEHACRETIHVANSKSSTIFEIVTAMEQITGHRAMYNLIAKGIPYTIDISRIATSLARCHIVFDDSYLIRTIGKYYGQHTRFRT